jgi:hypothetical protein
MRLPIDEARLLPRFRDRAQLERQQVDVSRKDGRGVREDVDVTPPPGHTVVPSPGELRGLPAIGWGVAGAQPGTQPEQALLAKERRGR